MMLEFENFRSKILGGWQGTCKLQVSPSEPVRESLSALLIDTIIKHKFLQLSYTWEEGGQPQEGLLLIGYQQESETATAVWLDSWHMGDSFMSLRGTLGASGRLILNGTYPVSEGADWGWSILLHSVKADKLQLTMENISPERIANWAVMGEYQRN